MSCLAHCSLLWEFTHFAFLGLSFSKKKDKAGKMVKHLEKNDIAKHIWPKANINADCNFIKVILLPAQIFYSVVWRVLYFCFVLQQNVSCRAVRFYILTFKTLLIKKKFWLFHAFTIVRNFSHVIHPVCFCSWRISSYLQTFLGSQNQRAGFCFKAILHSRMQQSLAFAFTQSHLGVVFAHTATHTRLADVTTLH